MEIVRQVLAALLVFGAVAVAVWARRRNGGTGWRVAGREKAGRLVALERVTLGPHHTLHVVRFGETLLLLAAHAGGCTLLASSARQEHEADNSPEWLL